MVDAELKSVLHRLLVSRVIQKTTTILAYHFHLFLVELVELSPSNLVTPNMFYDKTDTFVKSYQF